MKRPTNNSGTNNRITRIGHLRKGQQQKKSKIKLCFLILGIIVTILLCFIYLMTSSLHRTVLEENEAFMYRLKQQKQKIDHPLNDEHINLNRELEMKQSSSKLFVTVVLPSVVNTRARHKRLTSIAKTWGPGANAIYVIHDPNEYVITPYNTTEAATESSDPLLKSVTFPQTLYVPESVATVDEGVPRLKYVMETIYNKYNPDYIFFVNDHTYVIPQHMCNFLNQYGNNDANDEQHYLYAGHALKPESAKYAFNSGAAGYFLSRDTMKGLIDRQRISDSETESQSKNNSDNKNKASDEKECRGTRKWLQGNPGLVTANCLKMTMNVDPTDTRDDFGRHVFHAYGIIRTVKGDFDSWYIKKHVTLKDIWGEDTKFNYELKKGKECCSPSTISFHYVEYAETIALYATFQKIMDVGGPSKITNEDLKSFMISVWPTEKKDVGGYSHNLPPLAKKEVWDDLLYVVKNIAPSSPFQLCDYNNAARK